MRARISTLIIDKDKDKHDYSKIVIEDAPVWFEESYDIKVIDSTKDILTKLNQFRGVDSIITIGDDLDFEPMNKMSFEFRKKWCHIDEFNENEIKNAIYATFLCNINRERCDQKLFSIFTCTFNTQPKILKRLYNSLLRQNYPNWNWWIIDDSSDNYVSDYLEKFHDPRITIFKNVTNHGNIGFNKHMIAMMCDGDYLVEVDHDDELTEDCLSKLYECFDMSGADFVYSDCLEIVDGAPINYGDDFSYGQGYYRQEAINDEEYIFPVTCRNINIKSIRGIHALPNHIRCWERNFYHKIGGHNIELSVLDDMDLLIRTFLYGRMAKVDKVLYIQHQGQSNNGQRSSTTTASRFKEIQRTNIFLKEKYDMAIHNRIVELGVNDLIWDEENKKSNLSMFIDTEKLTPMDLLILQ